MKNFIIDPLKGIKSYQELLEGVGDKESIYLHGLVKESMPHLAYGLHKHTGRFLAFIVENEREGRRVYEQFQEMEKDCAEYYPALETSFFELKVVEDKNEKQRLKVMNRLMRKEPFILVSTLKAMLRPLQNRKDFEKSSLTIDLDQEINVEQIQEILVNLKYEKNSMVETKGEFAVRGGIVDIFPVSMENPVRIELFGDEIDSMRIFEVESQRSLENIESFSIGPSRELILSDSMRNTVIRALEKEIQKAKDHPFMLQGDPEKTIDKFTGIVHHLKEGLRLNSLDLIFPYLKEKDYTVFPEYMPEDSIVFFEDLSRVYDENQNEYQRYLEEYTYQLEQGEVFESHEEILLPASKILDRMKNFTPINATSLLKRTRLLNPKINIKIESSEAPSFNRDMDEMVRFVEKRSYDGFKVILLAESEENAYLFYDLLEKENIPAAIVEDLDTDFKTGQVFITKRNAKAGMEYKNGKFSIISHKEIYGKQKIKQHKKKKKSTSRDLINYTDLRIGDFVVHESHGIGEYRGVSQIDVQGVTKDYLVLQYRGQDKLFIPTDQMNLVQKYIGNEKRRPSLNKLGGTEWIKAKQKAKKSVDEMAQDLIELYAKRSKLKGHAFGPDTPWQKEFEESFIYEETYSQLRSIDEIKKDMESDKPMDRLLCGDVGYGKTEVAIRAAFKAVMDGKQVAFLVPTTILAQQHYHTIKERFKNFPVRVDVLSRFRTAKQQKDSIEGVRTGVVDMVVGTHRLLSKKLEFKDLGLLIVDEEQRFGVKHKEQLKKIKEDVDVLTLSATPIPRTLQMGLVGIRDMSLLEEPPEERYPTTSYIIEFEPSVIQEAVRREMDRGGQIYFVYNRIEDIDDIHSKLQNLVPEARIAVAHGRMQEKVLEQIMMDFTEGRYDILLSTTIIETGLDIQNVNTMVIYNADRMGLSQLYQLKGRIGRGERSSFAYFTYRKGKSLAENSEKRLMAIKDFSEFGSGYKIAMRDLELRGAGNILGESQHGHVAAIGYDLYAKLLEEAVREAKGEKAEERKEVVVEIPVDGYIPSTYIGDQDEKIDMYKKIASTRSQEDYEDLIEELVDRFGDIPKSVLNLMKIALLKSYAGLTGFHRVRELKGRLFLEFEKIEDLSLEIIGALSEQYGELLSFSMGEEPNINLDFKDKKLDTVIDLLQRIYSLKIRID